MNMTREIKFRVWMKNDKYPEGHLYIPEENPDFVVNFHGDLIECFVNGNAFARIGNQEIKIMQFTGLHDKNGKEIYEGDIVKYGDNIEEVIFTDGMFKVIDWDLITATMVEDGCEVIGNVFLNKDLIN